MTLNHQALVDQAQQLILQKEEIERKIHEQEAILKSHHVDVVEDLIDELGFPRADVDIYAVRNARSELASKSF